MKNHDIIYNIEESPEAGIFMEQSLLPSDLQRPKDIRAEWCFEYSSGQKAMLYLKKIYSSKEGKSNEASIYKNKLAEKYGKDDLGIPAIWYSGKITALSCPKDLFGEIVTKNVAEFDIEKGQVISRNFLDIAKPERWKVLVVLVLLSSIRLLPVQMVAGIVIFNINWIY